ncbi:hypothetical protein CLU79DRAFT_201678 [Phycomyces nitens]|nr:hypothetical protein CLU79DRAFT_201678 [Phycomyces nitens]
MGKQVVYEIRFSNRTEYGDLIAKKQKQLKEYEKAKIDTTDLSLEIAELYVERCDDLDNKLSQDDIERDLNEYLQNAIRICNNVYLKKGQDDMILARIYELLIQCYKKLEYHESAIKGCTELLSILKRQYPRDLSRLQKAYKTLGDLYFTNGHDPEEALFSDFQNAWENYSLEREILDSKVLKDGYDDINLRLTLSSNINMGVMLGKIPNPKFKAETFFVAATKIAKQLNDHEAEKECWREFGNFFQHYRHWDNALMCQRKEIKLARMLGSKEDELSCRIDNVKVYLEIEKFDE